MKNSFLPRIFMIFFVFVIYNEALAQGYDITIRINNIKDTAAYLGYNFGDQKFVSDTSKVSNGNTLRFTGKKTLPAGIYFVYSPNVYFEIIVNEQKFTLETDTTEFVRHLKIEGSKENRLFNEFQKFMADSQAESAKLAAKMDSLRKANDTTAAAGIQKEIVDIGEQIKSYQQKLITNNPGTFVSRLVNAMQKPEVPDPPKNEKGEIIVDKSWQFNYYKKHFFDNFDLADSGLLRSPVYQPKLDEYMDKLTYQHPDSITAAVDYLLSKAESSREAFRYLLVKLTNKYETSNIMGMERVFVNLAEKYYMQGKAYWADSSLVAKFSQRVREMKPNLVGNIAPDMQLLDTLMKPVRLASLRSRFIILYFYDPDCGHCKKVTPELYNLYNSKLKEKNVGVWAACIVTDVKKWKNYIRTNHLDWLNVADPYLRSNFRAEYDIKTTPTIYILDSRKEIIAKRIGVEQIEDFINRMIEIEDLKSKS
ncbi:MAG TPA: thioredoxin-like domain-containing protein [Cyclobacteriaceae bacterium]|nr:thioredoxin-like domain-containing protein [Cyclobacteriaceae bacterium]